MAKVDQGAIVAMATGMKVTAVMVHHVQIPSRYRYLH
jgi:hypothetical protein